MNDEQTRTRFETLLLPLMNDAYNLTRWLMKNQEDAEDMVQESYLRANRFFGSSTRERTVAPGSCESCETHAPRRWELMT
jgi:DNA-directed RNA polymerase specialized sigma24 family protein